MAQLQKRTALDVAAAALNRRAYTKMELRKKLYRKPEFEPSEIEGALAKLEDMDFLSDRRYAEDFIRIMRGRSYGDRRIFEKLTLKGIDRELVKEVMNAAQGERDPLDDAMALLERRARRLDNVDDVQKRNHRIMCMLAGRGFPPDVIYRAIGLWNNREKS